MPRFVILDHDHPFPHWDFLLESGELLCGWRLLSEPVRGRPVAAEALPDHRPVYLDYEGPISGGRGRVMRWDRGSFDWLSNGPDELRVAVHGQVVRGAVSIRRCANGGWEWVWL
jgi:hypothetical protein